MAEHILLAPVPRRPPLARGATPEFELPRPRSRQGSTNSASSLGSTTTASSVGEVRLAARAYFGSAQDLSGARPPSTASSRAEAATTTRPFTPLASRPATPQSIVSDVWVPPDLVAVGTPSGSPIPRPILENIEAAELPPGESARTRTFHTCVYATVAATFLGGLSGLFIWLKSLTQPPA